MVGADIDAFDDVDNEIVWSCDLQVKTPRLDGLYRHEKTIASCPAKSKA
jgi:hypothetical protein